MEVIKQIEDETLIVLTEAEYKRLLDLLQITDCITPSILKIAIRLHCDSRKDSGIATNASALSRIIRLLLKYWTMNGGKSMETIGKTNDDRYLVAMSDEEFRAFGMVVKAISEESASGLQRLGEWYGSFDLEPALILCSTWAHNADLLQDVILKLQELHQAICPKKEDV